MRYKTGKEFLKSSNKCVLLMGLSGVGKTTVCQMMPRDNWFHYSVDYRVFTHYLYDSLSDYIKTLAMENPHLKEMLRRDSITVEPRVSVDNLYATTRFLGMLGDPDKAGRSLRDFNAVMAEHAQAEVSAVRDVSKFRKRAQDMYGYEHFLVDPTGSLCEVIELDDQCDALMKFMEQECLVVYIEASDEHTSELLKRAEADPKPIYYRPDFLKKEVPGLLRHYKSKRVEEIDPIKVGRYLYPRILEHRIPRYKTIADRIGYTISMNDILEARTADDVLRVIADAIDSV